MTQQGDVRLFQTNNDGDIVVEGGIVEFSGGLETFVYLALFGGNELDDGRALNPHNWWGNLGENDPARQYRSETQYLIESIPAVPSNLRIIEDAVTRDLTSLLDINAASSITVSATIPGLDRLGLQITIEADGVESSFEFVENWRAGA